VRLSPHDPDVLYHTSQFVNRTRDAGYSWETISPDLTRNDTTKQDYAGGRITWDNTGVEVYGTIFAFEESPHEAGVLWVGTDDGLVHVSRDDGANWENVTPPDLPEFSTVNIIDLSAHGPGRAHVAVYRYRMADDTPYMWRTDDYGQTWTRLSANGIEPGHFDTIVLNSVAQYFPSEAYLRKMIEGAVAALRPGGRLFAGDIRSLPLLHAFHASVQEFRASDDMTTEQLRRRVHHEMNRDQELVVDPAFFDCLSFTN